MTKKIVILIFSVILFSYSSAFALPGDLDGSGRVDGYDLILFGRANGATSSSSNWNPAADLNGDGVVNSADLAILSSHFGNSGVSFGLWVGDQKTGTDRVSKVSSVGNVLFRTGSFSYPGAISSNVTDGSVWIGDSTNNKVYKLDPATGATLLTINNIDAFSVSVNSKDGSVWVVDNSAGKIIKILPSVTNGYTIGTDTGSHISVSGFNYPRSVSVNPETGVVWVADTNNNRIVRISPDVNDGYNIATDSGKHIVKAGFSVPYAVSVNPADGSVWVADTNNNQAVQLASTGTVELYRIGGFSQPGSLAVNYVDGSVWVIDKGHNRVVRLSFDGAILATAGGFSNPMSLSVNPLDGSCWVADTGNNQVIRLSPNGSKQATITGFSSPLSVAVTPDAAAALKSPVASTSLSSNNVDVGAVITFTGTGTDPDGTIVKYEWDFDGAGVFDFQSATAGVATHSFSTIGVYNPVFRVTDNSGLTATDYSQIIRVGALKAIAGADKITGNAPLTIAFTAGFIDPINGFVDTYQWDFDGDNIFDYYSETNGNTSFTYAKAGTYKATLKITDGPHVATDSLTITVLPSPPVATVSATPVAGGLPMTVNFTGSGSDPDGKVVLYELDFNGDGVYDWLSTSTTNASNLPISQTASYTYASAGSYKARFRVLDNDGLTDFKEINISVGLPLPIAVANADKTKGYPDLTVNFNAAGSSDPGGAITAYEWNFDGECANTIIFGDNMEAGISNWTADSPWGQITSDSHSATHSWTDSPGGNYAANVNAALTSKSFNLSNVSSATLSFWHHYNIEFYYDNGRAEISVDGGATWTQLAAYNGTLSAWTQVQIDLAPYLGNANVKIRFRLTSDSSGNYDGWYIDDVNISSCAQTWTPSADGRATHKYTTTGLHKATLRVTGKNGKSTDSIDITVTPLTQPTASATASPLKGISPLPVTFTGSGQDPKSADGTAGRITNYNWNFGEEYVWVADSSNDNVVRLYQDGSGEAARATGFNDPDSVSVNPTEGTVWVSDYYNHQIVKLSQDGKKELARLGGFSYPASVSVNRTDGTVWVADYYHNQVVKLKADGSGELARVGGFSSPQCVSVNPTDGTVWVADYSNNQVVKLKADGSGELARVSGFSSPQSVSVNPTDGTVWVADTSHNQVVKLKADGSGEMARVSGFSSPQSVSVNPTDGTVWVADRYHDQVVKLKADGSGEMARVSGFSSPMYVSVNSVDGTVWVADYYHNQVVKLKADGSGELARVGGFNYPKAVVVAESATNRFSSATTGNTTHTYNKAGAYRAVFTVVDNDGNTDKVLADIKVDGLPSVSAGADITGGSAPLKVFLYGSAADLDGSITKYEWDFDGNGSYDWSSQSGANVVHTYGTAGAYAAKLRVTDNDGHTNTAVVNINVTKSLPSVTAGAAPVKGNASLLVNFYGTASDPDGSITKYEWDFNGDGTYDYSSVSSPVSTYTYTTPGTYTAVLRVTDNDGQKVSSSVQVAVNAAGTPSAIMYADPTQGTNPLTVKFCGQGFDPDGTISGYAWDFNGDGTYDKSSTTPPTAFGDKMEDGTANWTADAPWARVYSDYYSKSYSWTDSPNGNYANNADTKLTSRTISLAGTASPTLVFWHKYDFRPGDYGRVEISGNDGSSWTELGSFTNATLSAWTKQEYNLAAYKGNATVKVRFRVTSDAADTADGWYIDDVWVGDCASYTYAAQGKYNATLRVTDNSGKTATATALIDVTANRNTSFTWVADYSHHQAVKLSDDGTELARISGFSNPRAVKVNSNNGDVWVADTGNNRVVKLSSAIQNGYNLSAAGNTSDSSSVKSSGALYGNAVIGTGKLGTGGLVVDGNGDYMDVPDSPAYKMGSWTMEAWIKPAATGGSRGIIGKVSQGKDFGLQLNGDKIAVLVYDGGRRYVEAPGAVTLDTWYHVAGVYDPSASGTDPDFKVKLYVNGAYVTGGNWTPDTSNSDVIRIGGTTCCGEWFSGVIDDVRIWNTARSAAAIAAGKDAELTGTEAGLVGYWKLNAASTLHQITTGFNQPFFTDIDLTDNSVWVTDRNNNNVVKLNVDGTIAKTVTGFSGPNRVSVYQADRSVWISDDYHHQVVKLDKDGAELFRSAGYPTFYNPSGVSVDQSDGSVWVADFYNNRVVKLSSAGAVLLAAGGITHPATVSVNQNDRTVWATTWDGDQVVKLSPTGNEIARVSGFDNPHDIEVNQKDGTVWVSDHYHHQMVKLAPDGTELVRDSGFYYPIGISVDAALRNLTAPPVATATVSPAGGNAPLTVTFTGSSTGTISRYQWDFNGDGTFEYDSPSTGNTTYTYNSPGTYNPIFRVTDNTGQIDYDGSKTVTVGPMTVLPKFSPASGNAPLDVALSGVVKGIAAGRSIVKYEWDFEGDGIFDWSGTAGPNTTKRYAVGGSYAPVLKVTDSAGAQAYGIGSILVNKAAPSAYSSATPTSGSLPLSVNLNGGGSDADGSIVLYEWDFNGDGVYDWFSTSSAAVTYTYRTAGTYNAALRVTDNDGFTAVSSQTITVGPSQVPPSVSVSADATEGNAPFTVNFTGTAVDPDRSSIVLYEWDFDGDGTYDWSSTTTGNTAKTYLAAGQYLARFRAKDIDNLTSTATVMITVKPAGAPKAIANAVPKSGANPLVVTFNADGSSDPGGSIVRYDWTFGEETLWAADFYNNNVVRLQDNVENLRLGGYYHPYRIVVNRTDGAIWVTDHENDKVVKLKADGSGELARLGGFDNPWGIALQQSTGDVWVSSWYQNQVVKIKADATGELARVSGFNHPAGLAVDESDGSVIVADYDNNRVVKLSGSGSEIARYYGFNRPIWVSVNQSDGSAWVADRYNKRVVKLDRNTPNGYNASVQDKNTPNVVSSGTSGFLANNAAFAAGKFGNGVSLDGSGDYVLLSRGPALDVQSFTVEAWIKPVNTSGNPAIFMRGDSGGGNELFFGLLNNTTIDTVLDGTENTFAGAVNFIDGAWHHVALTYDSSAGQLKAYVDGSQYGSTVSILKTLDFGGSDALIGADFDCFNGCLGNYFNGMIDDLRLWNVVRSAADITGNKNAELSGSPAGLAGYWKFNAAENHHKALSLPNEALCTEVDPNNGSVWACDYNDTSSALSNIVKIDSGCARTIFSIPGYARPHQVAVNPLDSTAWIADHNNSRVVKLSADGRELGSIGGFNGPTSVAILNPSGNAFSSPTTGTTAHTYKNVGEYTATLKVTDNSGLTDTDTVAIKSGLFPEALPQVYPTSGVAPLKVRFASNGKSPAGTIEYYYWDFNGDGIIDNSGWSTQIPETFEYTFQTPGTYTASLKVIDNRGLSDKKYVVITVLPPSSAPTAKASASPTQGNSPLTVDFTGLGSVTDSTINKFEWDFDGNGAYDYSSAATATTSHTYNAVGSYIAKLRVTAGNGLTGTDSVLIKVKQPGSPTAVAAAAPTSGFATLKVDFSGSGTDDGTIVKYEWDFDGDGVYDWSSTETGNTFHNYPLAGTYNATLRVTDNAGLKDTASVTISVATGLSATLSSDAFDPSVAQTVSINSVITNAATISIKIRDKVSNLVRTLVNNASRAAGYYSDAWDGKDNSGHIVDAGVYLYVIEYTVGGQTYVYDVTNNVDLNKYPPSVTYPGSFDPFSSMTNFFRYTLPGKSEVTINMSHWNWHGYWGAGPRVRTLLMRKPLKAGSYVMTWDGTDDSGNLVEAGDYLITVWGYYLPANAIIVQTEPVISDLLPLPVYLNPDAKPYDDVYQETFTYTVSKPVKVTASIYDAANFLVRTITINGVPAGTGNKVVWDGKNNSGKYVLPGTYRIKLVAVDAKGNSSMDANALVVIYY